MLVSFVDMQLRLQQIRTLAHNMTFVLHHMSVIFMRSELQKCNFRYNLITTNCDHISEQKIGIEVRIHLSK